MSRRFNKIGLTRLQAAGARTAAATTGQASAVGRVHTNAAVEMARAITRPLGGLSRCSATSTVAAVHMAMAAATSVPLGLTDELRNSDIGVAATATPGTMSAEVDHTRAVAAARARKAAPSKTLATCIR